MDYGNTAKEKQRELKNCKHHALGIGYAIFSVQEELNQLKGQTAFSDPTWNPGPVEKSSVGLGMALSELWTTLPKGAALAMMSSLIVETACDWPDLPRVLDEITANAAKLESDADRAAQLAFCHWLRCELVARQ